MNKKLFFLFTTLALLFCSETYPMWRKTLWRKKCLPLENLHLLLVINTLRRPPNKSMPPRKPQKRQIPPETPPEIPHLDFSLIPSLRRIKSLEKITQMRRLIAEEKLVVALKELESNYIESLSAIEEALYQLINSIKIVEATIEKQAPKTSLEHYNCWDVSIQQLMSSLRKIHAEIVADSGQADIPKDRIRE